MTGTLVVVWGLAVLGAVVVLTLAGAPIPVVLALIACLPRPFEPEPPRTQCQVKDDEP